MIAEKARTSARLYTPSYLTLFFLVLLALSTAGLAQTLMRREISGTVVTANGEAVPGVTVEIITGSATETLVADETGRFAAQIAPGGVSVRLSGKNLKPVRYDLSNDDKPDNLTLLVEYVLPTIYAELVINAAQLEPGIERRNERIFNDTLFSRDDQILQILDSGITAGQHEGGGKSLEIRRFGFNLDHGGVNGGLKVLTDNVQQNQTTQGHGQGYLGALKSLSPELVEAVDIVNGPFSAEYGDFSGLGVVHIRTRQSLPQQLTVRLQGGRFGMRRAFFAYSPPIRDAAFLSYDRSRTDGPFLQPLNYRRDNLTGNYTRQVSGGRAFGVKFNFSRNDFRSSGQIPLDEVAAGNIDRFGFVDPDIGGRVRSGTLGLYFRDENASGRVLKIDAFATRSLFDLYSNFTFFLHDPVNGDEIVQHDSRLQEGVNTQYVLPVRIGGVIGAFTAGANFHANQINVGLDRSTGRTPFENVTKADASVNNYAAYAQQSLDLFNGSLNLTFGLRFDRFTFSVKDRLDTSLSGKQSAGKLQPKFGVSYTPSRNMPLRLHFNYGRGIVSQDARGVVRRPAGPKIAVTDFYQGGVSYNSKRFSGSIDAFLIDRSHEQVFVPDDGSIELAGPTRAFGYEAKTSLRLHRYLSLNAGFAKVIDAFYRGTAPRIYLDSSPHLTGNAAITLDGLYGFGGSIRYRHGSGYRLDGLDDNLRASGFDLLDLSISKRVTGWLDLNFSIDNVTNKRYFETQNHFESRVRPGAPATARTHVTPGFPLAFTLGITIRLGKK